MQNKITKEDVEKWLSDDNNLLKLDHSFTGQLGLDKRVTIIRAMIHSSLSGDNTKERLEKLQELKLEMIERFYLGTDDGTMDERYRSMYLLLPEFVEVIFGNKYALNNQEDRLIMSSILPLSGSETDCFGYKPEMLRYYEGQAYIPNQMIDHITNDTGFKSGWDTDEKKLKETT